MFGREKRMYKYKKIIIIPKDEEDKVKEEVINIIDEYRNTIVYTKEVDTWFTGIYELDDDKLKIEIIIHGYKDLEKSRRLYDIDRELLYALNDGNYSDPRIKNDITVLPFERFEVE